MNKVVGFYKKNGRTRPITRRSGKSRAKEDMKMPRTWKDIEGSYAAFGSTPGDAFGQVMHKIYLKSSYQGYRGETEFSGKYGDGVNKQFFMTYGGNFEIDYYIDNIPKLYVINGTVSKKGKGWVATAKVSGVEI